jgi:hypothetical protein
VPWFLFVGPNKSLSVSEVAAQMNLDFSENRNVKDAVSIIRKHAKALDNAIGQSMPADQVDFSGIVITINYPTNSDEVELSTSIYDAYIKADKIGGVVAAQITVGYQVDNNAYFNYGLSVYRVLLVPVPQGPQGTVLHVVNAEDVPAREKGLAVRVDINCRPLRGEKSADRSLSGLAQLIKDALSGSFTRVLGSFVQPIEVH